MRKPGTDPEHVRMSDVLCDFCHREWTEDVPMVEGHHGSCICGRCLTVAYAELVLSDPDRDPTDYKCPLCLEANVDREALARSDEPGWRSPLQPDLAICRRCVKQAAGALHKDPDYAWRKPVKGVGG